MCSWETDESKRRGGDDDEEEEEKNQEIRRRVLDWKNDATRWRRCLFLLRNCDFYGEELVASFNIIYVKKKGGNQWGVGKKIKERGN